MDRLKNVVKKMCLVLPLIVQFCATGAEQMNDALAKKDSKRYRELLLKVSSTDEMISVLKSMEKQPDETHLEFLRVYKEVFAERNLLDDTDSSAQSNEGFNISRRKILQDFLHGMLGLIHGEADVPITLYSATANGRPLCEATVPQYYPTLAAETSESGQYAAWVIAIYCGDVASVQAYQSRPQMKIPGNWPQLFAVYYSEPEKIAVAKRMLPMFYEKTGKKPLPDAFLYEEPTRGNWFYCVGCIEYLIEKKVSFRNPSGSSVLGLAKASGHDAIVQKLLKAGARQK
ncbi:hypothetical protein [Turneriella parva]|uniref:Ankyrin n=1 Tax=Turneriella parva (strain ATCC BAA-1111 / DSM 21527 / NCTC 11395 / H) TaxID=869212 RepID=I4BAC0_TURPD|nr:hypothetical protein [Turneriella parva]AFM14227.1 hypothetical protein Turpa_3593 [Turneriella parva DSM 21527]